MQELIFEIIKLSVIVVTPIISIFLIFRRDIKSIKAYTKDFQCAKCGHCCKFSILLSKKDIQKIISNGYKEDEFIKRKIFLNMLKKNKSGFCVFLNDDNTCNIYEVRPSTCQKFPYINYVFFKGCDLRCPQIKF